MLRHAVLGTLFVTPIALAQPFQIEKLYQIEVEVLSGRTPIFPGFYPAADGSDVFAYELAVDEVTLDWHTTLFRFTPAPEVFHEELWLADSVLGHGQVVVDDGIAVFEHNRLSAGDLWALWKLESGVASPLLNEGEARPGGGQYTRPSPQACSGGHVLFADFLPGSVYDGYFLYDLATDAVRRVAAVGDVIETMTVNQFGIAGVDSDGRAAAFFCDAGGDCLLFYSNTDGTTEPIARTGDSIDGGQVVSFFGRPIFLDDGLVFGATVDDGSGTTTRNTYIRTALGIEMLLPGVLYLDACRIDGSRFSANAFTPTNSGVFIIGSDASMTLVADRNDPLDGTPVQVFTTAGDSADQGVISFYAQQSAVTPGDPPRYVIYRVALATCRADLTTTNAPVGDPNYGVPDGVVSAVDLQYYVNAWVVADASIADMTTTNAPIGDPNYGVPDGVVSAADIQFYVNLWIAGCP